LRDRVLDEERRDALARIRVRGDEHADEDRQPHGDGEDAVPEGSQERRLAVEGREPIEDEQEDHEDERLDDQLRQGEVGGAHEDVDDGDHEPEDRERQHADDV
jgi:hypothetical protein